MLSFKMDDFAAQRKFVRETLLNSSVAHRLGGSIFLILLAGCSAVPPPLPDNTGLVPAHYSSGLAHSAQVTQPALLSWWKRFDDPVLNDCVKQALEVNGDLAIALTRVAQSRAIETHVALDLLPEVDVGGSIMRQRTSLMDPRNIAPKNLPGFKRDSTTFRTESNFNWELDLFGRKEFLKNASRARADASQADANAVRLFITAEVARNVIVARTLQARIKLAVEAASIESELVDITHAKKRGGLVSDADLLRAVSLEQDSLAAIASLESDYADSMKSIAILLAETPRDVRTRVALPGELKPALDIPDSGLPSELLRRRPDIQRAELQLEAATQDLAAAKADRFPRINLGATLAWVAGSVSSLGSADALLATVVPSLTWRALDFGRLDAEISRANGVQKEALLRYKQTATMAFAEADTALSNLQHQAQIRLHRESSVDALLMAWELGRLQYERGSSDFSTALDIKRNLIRSRDLAALARQSQLLANVAAYRALGGGWDP